MAKTKLKTEQNTPEMCLQVERLFDDCHEESGREHDGLAAFFEHGQWWVACNGCGASWSVVDVNDDIGIEHLEDGDESCPSL